MSERLCAGCGRPLELRRDNRGNYRCTACWAINAPDEPTLAPESALPGAAPGPIGPVPAPAQPAPVVPPADPQTPPAAKRGKKRR